MTRQVIDVNRRAPHLIIEIAVSSALVKNRGSEDELRILRFLKNRQIIPISGSYGDKIPVFNPQLVGDLADLIILNSGNKILRRRYCV